MASGTYLNEHFKVRTLLSQYGASFGTSYPIDTSNLTAVAVWVNQSGYRDCLFLPKTIMAGAYIMSIGGVTNAVRVDVAADSIKVTKRDSSLSNNLDIIAYGYT